MSERKRRVLLRSRSVRERYDNASAIWLWRRCRDDPRFPKPVKIGNRNYWYEDELQAYEKALGNER